MTFKEQIERLAQLVNRKDAEPEGLVSESYFRVPMHLIVKMSKSELKQFIALKFEEIKPMYGMATTAKMAAEMQERNNELLDAKDCLAKLLAQSFIPAPASTHDGFFPDRAIDHCAYKRMPKQAMQVMSPTLLIKVIEVKRQEILNLTQFTTEELRIRNEELRDLEEVLNDVPRDIFNKAMANLQGSFGTLANHLKGVLGSPITLEQARILGQRAMPKNREEDEGETRMVKGPGKRRFAFGKRKERSE